MNFLVDAQLPPALARWITAQGHNAQHVIEIDLQTADDAVIWKRALERDVVIVTKDEDFVNEWLLSPRPARLIWIRKGNCSNRELLAWMAPMWPEAVMRLVDGEHFVELRG